MNPTNTELNFANLIEQLDKWALRKREIATVLKQMRNEFALKMSAPFSISAKQYELAKRKGVHPTALAIEPEDEELQHYLSDTFAEYQKIIDFLDTWEIKDLDVSYALILYLKKYVEYHVPAEVDFEDFVFYYGTGEKAKLDFYDLGITSELTYQDLATLGQTLAHSVFGQNPELAKLVKPKWHNPEVVKWWRNKDIYNEFDIQKFHFSQFPFVYLDKRQWQEYLDKVIKSVKLYRYYLKTIATTNTSKY